MSRKQSNFYLIGMAVTLLLALGTLYAGYKLIDVKVETIYLDNLTKKEKK